MNSGSSISLPRLQLGSWSCAATLIMSACGADPKTNQIVPPSWTDAAVPLADASTPVVVPPMEVTPPVCPPTNPFCQTVTKPPPAQDCGNEVVDLNPTGVNVMVAIDGSSSMRPHWTRVRDAVAKLRKENPQSSFGLHLFYGEPVENLDQLLEKNNLCGKTQNKLLDVAARSEQELLDFVGTVPPGPNTRILPTSPLVEPINYYLTNPTKLADPTRTNYLVIISDGADNCFGSTFADASDKRLALEKLAVDLSKKNIRILPISFVAGQTGNGMPTAATQARMAALDTLAKYGGSGLEKALQANKPEDLITAIGQAGQRAGNCRFSIPASLDPSKALNPFELIFSVNGQPLTRDRRNVEGWNFVGGTTTEVELFGKSCEAVRAGVKVEAKKSCSREVCGTAAVQVETKPRAVLYVLDSSASRLECQSGDALRCLLPQGNTTMPDMSYWDIVAHSLGRSLVEPINDDIHSGLQFFPAKTSGLLSCEVGGMPEVALQARSQITIMSKMLERLPFGRSPVVAALESIAANPGKLADPAFSGAVVMLTDGGDNCGGEGQTQAATVASLEASAAKLLKAGVKTYVVRFGNPNGKTPEQEEQLRAIVTKGGTATIDPNDKTKPPYIDAVDATALDAALAKVSDRLASCSFAVNGIAPTVDKSKANLYLNGELIRFDQAGQASDGWGWANPEKTAIELYGNACNAFKTNRKTSVGVEFGCPAVVLL